MIALLGLLLISRARVVFDMDMTSLCVLLLVAMNVTGENAIGFTDGTSLSKASEAEGFGATRG